MKFQVSFSSKVIKQLQQLPLSTQKQYDKAFQLIATEGPAYPSLRTHRYQLKKREIWGSAASMALRFYWDYAGVRSILVISISSH